MTTREGSLDGKGLKIGIVASRFNRFITDSLVSGAKDMLTRLGVEDSAITLVWVPGAFEIPLAAKVLAESKKVDAILTLGAVIRGATPHFDYVCSQCAAGIQSLSNETKLPIAFGVLTTDSIEQAIERAGTKSGNKGADAAMTAIEMINLLRKLG